MENNEPMISIGNCMARTPKNTQCAFKKKFGDFCGKHNKDNISRIDEPVPVPVKLKRKKKTVVVKDIEHRLSLHYSAIKIQSLFKAWLLRRYNKMRGLALFNRRLCVNDTDVYLLDDITTIYPTDFFSMLDADGFVYGFHIETIYKHIDMNKDKPIINNPYNQNPLTTLIVHNVRTLHSYCLKRGFINKIENDIPNEELYAVRNKTVSIFQKMDQLNNYTNIDWFMELSHHNLFRLLYNVKDLYEYRMNLDSIRKMELMPEGRIFNKPRFIYKQMSFERLQHEILDEFNILVSFSENRDDRYLGCLIILTGLVDISPNCALEYPWIVQGNFQEM